jgi:hypothetical protein
LGVSFWGGGGGVGGGGPPATRETPRPEASPPEPREVETARLPDGSSADRSRRPLLIGVGVMALILAAAIVALIAGGGGDGGNAEGGTSSATTTQDAKQKSKPETLTEAELIRRGDEICEESRAKFLRYRDPEAEEVPDVAYSRVLVGISTNAVEQFEALKPPKAMESQYARYVASQQEVRQWDRDALAAAEAEDPSAYLEARRTRDDTEADRKQLAEEIGFHVCSGSEA